MRSQCKTRHDFETQLADAALDRTKVGASYGQVIFRFENTAARETGVAIHTRAGHEKRRYK